MEGSATKSRRDADVCCLSRIFINFQFAKKALIFYKQYELSYSWIRLHRFKILVGLAAEYVSYYTTNFSEFLRIFLKLNLH